MRCLEILLDCDPESKKTWAPECLMTYRSLSLMSSHLIPQEPWEGSRVFHSCFTVREISSEDETPGNMGHPAKK